MHKLDYTPCDNIDCYFVELAALYAKRVIYGYKCDLEQLYQDMQDSRRFGNLACYIAECELSGSIVDQLRKFKSILNYKYTNICRDCE